MLWLLHVLLIGFHIGPKSGDMDASARSCWLDACGISSWFSVWLFAFFWSSIILLVNSISLICSRIKWNSGIWLKFFAAFLNQLFAFGTWNSIFEVRRYGSFFWSFWWEAKRNEQYEFWFCPHPFNVRFAKLPIKLQF